MRGETSTQSELFSYVSLESRIPADHPIRRIRNVVDNALADINTQGTVTFAPGPSTRAKYAIPPPEEPSPETTEAQPKEQLQALIDNANDDRSLWERAQDGAASAWDGTKRIATASWENPGEFGKGVAKGIGNLPSDIANLAVEGIKSGGGFNPLSLNNYAKLLDYQAMNAYQAGNIPTANTMASHANSIREFG